MSLPVGLLHLKAENKRSNRLVSPPAPLQKKEKKNFQEPEVFPFPPLGSPAQPLQNQLAKSHFTKVAEFCCQQPGPLRCHQISLELQAVNLGLSCVGLDQTKSHRYQNAPVQLAPQGPLIERGFGPNGGGSELNLQALGPSQVSISTVPSASNRPRTWR